MRGSDKVGRGGRGCALPLKGGASLSGGHTHPWLVSRCGPDNELQEEDRVDVDDDSDGSGFDLQMLRSVSQDFGHRAAGGAFASWAMPFFAVFCVPQRWLTGDVLDILSASDNNVRATLPS